MNNPLRSLLSYYRLSHENGDEYYHACCLSTIDEHNKPHSRMVSIKSIWENAVVFATNICSDKGRHIQYRPYVSLCFFWPRIHVQVRCQGVSYIAPRCVSDMYFSLRSRDNCLVSCLSQQSQSLSSYEEFVSYFHSKKKYFSDNNIPFTRKDSWSSIIVYCTRIEFWFHGDNHLNKRLYYTRNSTLSNIWEGPFFLYP